MSNQEVGNPSWATKPKNGEWILTEIKEGVQIAQHELSKRPCTWFGRAADAVDIPLGHESCSRRHARITFYSNRLWLLDYGSTHGTMVNKRRLPAQASIKDNDARGVLLFPGDVIGFGASSRLFCLEGPSEYERDALKRLKIEAFVKKDEGGSELDLGAEVESAEAEALIKTETLSAKNKEEWNRIEAMKMKLVNIQSESDKIRAKGELTSGQEQHLERNMKRETDLMRKIDEKETILRTRVLDKETPSSNHSSQTCRTIEDEVEDWTKESNEAEELPKERSRASLQAECDSLENAIRSKCNELTDSRQALVKLRERVNVLDETDSFFVANEMEIQKQKHEKLEKDLASLKTRLLGSRSLLETHSDCSSMLPPPSLQITASLEKNDSQTVSASDIPSPKRRKVET